MRLLILEDDAQLGDALATGLRQLGHAVDWFASGAQADAAIDSAPYDAAVLDLGLPGTDGMVWLRRWRERGSALPVLILTARDGVQQRIAGLDAGADDYLIKPFDFGELLARLRALFRRSAPERRPVSPTALEVGDLRIDPATRVVTRAGREVTLTAREFEVLEYLARHEGEVVSRAQLLEHVWAGDFDGSPNIVDVYIGYLRKKLERPSGRRLIRTVRGSGFVLDPG